MVGDINININNTTGIIDFIQSAVIDFYVTGHKPIFIRVNQIIQDIV